MPTLKVRRLSRSARLPERAHPTDAGLDVFAAETVTILPGDAPLVRTGIALELPPNTEAQIRPRSGLALRSGVTVLNSPGTIDEGYRGEVAVILINHGREPFEVAVGARIAQLVVQPVLMVEVEEAAALTTTDRGSGGFGSTG